MNPLKNYKMKDNRQIQQAAVIGSGIMGSRIACHLANVGIQVLLLDITPLKLNESEEKQGFDLDQDIVKNRIVKDALKSTLKSRPSSLYQKEFAHRISTGNLSDDFNEIVHADWIIEVVVERLDIKKRSLKKWKNIENQAVSFPVTPLESLSI